SCLYEDSGKRIWVGTDAGGVNIFDRNTGKYIDYGQVQFDRKTGRIQNKLQNRIRDILEDSKGKLWVATSDGLTYYDPYQDGFNMYYKADYTNNNSLNFNDLYSLYEDDAGSLWIGTYGNGVNVYHPTKWKFNHYKKNNTQSTTFKSDVVHAFHEDGSDAMLIGTKDGGLIYFNRSRDSVVNYIDVPGFEKIHSSILAIHKDSDGLIWLGTWGGGLQRVNRKKREVITYSKPACAISNNTVLCIYEEDNQLWLGTFGGLCKFDKKSTSFATYNASCGLGSDHIFCITGNGTDTIWVGTMYGGFNIFNKKTGTAESFVNNIGDTTSLSYNTVVHIYDDGNKTVWIATESGLNRFDKETRRFTRYYRKDGLPNDHIYAIVPDDNGYLWLSTNKGISRFDPHAIPVSPSAFMNYDVEHGLQANEFNQCAYYKSGCGEIFFGGPNGFNSFHPSRMTSNKHIIPVHFTSFKMFDNIVHFDTAFDNKASLKLSYRENFIAFEFVGLDYVFPNKNLYSYKMEGLDMAWSNPSTRRFASYPNLEHGNYIFHVRAANNDGIWNRQGKSIGIVITPPFYKRPVFIISMILFIIIAVFLSVKARLDRIKKEKKILEQKVAERTRELQQKNEDIMSSIEYAKRIQEALLPGYEGFFRYFSDAFVLYKPKDIVSGDFFWFTKVQNRLVFAVVDCTGHGVPGAFMSIIGDNMLRHIILEEGILDTSLVLKTINKDVRIALKQHDATSSFDGMDLAFCVFDAENSTLEFAGANRPLFMIKNNQFSKIEGNKFSIGGALMPHEKKFDSHTITIEKNDVVYLFTDGYADQFGGTEAGGKKFMLRNFQELLININEQPMAKQLQELDLTIEDWMKSTEQTDDITVLGLRF
ncbi:MAG: SpoIIE family protein phosphatase, partial [Bacteroidetes bacterium]|nr:SpoIIE family protein phosphatase [Bacteroidota bacterium]